jgi:hypothetical protein
MHPASAYKVVPASGHTQGGINDTSSQTDHGTIEREKSDDLSLCMPKSGYVIPGCKTVPTYDIERQRR